MNDLRPYEKELARQLNDCLLPDMNPAWDDMKKMLDDDDRKRGVPPVPPAPTGINRRWWWFLALLFTIGSSYFVYTRMGKKETSGTIDKNATNSFMKNSLQSTGKNTAQPIFDSKGGDSVLSAKEDKGQQNSLLPARQTNDNNSVGDSKNLHTGKDKGGQPELSPSASVNDNRKLQPVLHRSYLNRLKVKNELPAQIEKANSIKNKNNKKKKAILISKKGKANINITDNGELSEKGNSDNSNPGKNTDGNGILKTGTINTKPADPGIKDKTIGDDTSKKNITVLADKFSKDTNQSVDNIKKPSSKKKRKYTIGLGVAMQQPVRIDCHCEYPNNTYTYRPVVADYLPSAYISFSAFGKWSLQAGFKYAMPQHIKQFLYELKQQNTPLNFLTTSYVMKKVYFHELPLSFNYSVFPHVSVGAGFVYNIFSAATSQVDSRKKIYGSESDSLISSVIVKDKNDSGFVNFVNYPALLLQSQYQYKRISFGLRYTTGLLPYVRYTDPFSGNNKKKYTTTLNLFIRYELWEKGK